MEITKTDLTGQQEIAGARLQLKDLDGRVLEQWISGDEPHRIETSLAPGETYVLHEDLAPAGYAYASDLPFTVSETGITALVQIEDAPTCVRVTKRDITGEAEVPGARMQILDMEGRVLEQWISGEEPHEITGKLEAGQT